jgi:flavin reductase (DIM6/NTAB) family NADH-FMN oxidoreductase RutF
MELDPDVLTPAQNYKLMTCLVIPRPIALVTSIGPSGVVNAAPFSFFNVMGSEPPIVVLGISDRPEGSPKDTAANIRRGRQFVVNLVSEEIVGKMNVCAIDFPPEIGELSAAGLTPTPSVKVAPPRIAESPVHLECEEIQTIAIGENRVVMGRVVQMGVRDGLVDPENLRVRSDLMHLVGRMHAPSWYTRTGDVFELPRQTYAQWKANQAEV